MTWLGLSVFTMSNLFLRYTCPDYDMSRLADTHWLHCVKIVATLILRYDHGFKKNSEDADFHVICLHQLDRPWSRSVVTVCRPVSRQGVSTDRAPLRTSQRDWEPLCYCEASAPATRPWINNNMNMAPHTATVHYYYNRSGTMVDLVINEKYKTQ